MARSTCIEASPRAPFDIAPGSIPRWNLWVTACVVAGTIGAVDGRGAPVAEARSPGWSVGRHNGVMTVKRDGIPVLLNILYDNDGGFERYAGVLSRGIAREGGFKVHMLHVGFDWARASRESARAAGVVGEMREPPPLSGLDRQTLARFARVSAEDPEGLFLVRITFWAPQSWRETHRTELCQDDRGEIPDTPYPPVSYASDLYFEIARGGIAHVVGLLERSEFGPRIIGYHPMTGYSGEWNQGSTSPSRIADYGPVNQAAFRAHLLSRYPTVEAINRAFDKSYVSERDIRVPAEEEFTGSDDEYYHQPASMRFTGEYIRFASDLLADRLLACCGTIKEIAPRKLAGASYAYWFGAAQGGVRGLLMQPHLSFERVAASPVFDYFLSPPVYWLCGPDHPAKAHTLLGSVDLHDKVYLAESDHPTHLVLHMDRIRAVPLIHTYKLQNDGARSLAQLYRDHRPAGGAPRSAEAIDEMYGVDFGRDHRDFLIGRERLGGVPNVPASDRVPSNMRESVSNLWRQGLQVITGQAAGVWWWDMEGCARKATGGVGYNHPEILRTMREMGELFERAPGFDRAPRAEVLVIYSERAIPFLRAGARRWSGGLGMLMANLKPLGECGVPYTDIYLGDLPRLREIDRYRLFIFANAEHVSDAERRWIERHLKRDGRVLVWAHGSGYLDDRDGRVENMERLTGIRFSREDRAGRLGWKLIAPEHPLARGLKAGDIYGETAEALSVEKGKPRDPDLVRPRFSCCDPRAEVLGIDPDGGAPGFVVRRCEGWTSVSIPGGPVPAALYRNLARLAGAHVYCEADDVQVWACRDILGLYAFGSAKGSRVIRIPGGIRALRDMVTGEVVPVRDDRIAISCEGARAWVYELVRE